MDLFLAAALIALLSLWAMMVGVRLEKKGSPGSQVVVQISVLVASGLYFLFVWNRTFLTYYLPHSALIVLANWHPIVASFFLGMYLSSKKVGRLRRLMVVPLTLLLAAYSIVAPLVGYAPVCGPSPSTSLLVSQSTPHTCSAAAAASLLRLYGIEATESEMAQLCLTRQGTHWMGVYRGLKMRTQQTSWKVVAVPFTRNAVLNLNKSPALLSVNFDTKGIAASEDHGFCGDAGHSVVALGSRGKREVMVFDPAPSYGLECWNQQLLSWISDGVILSLEPRDDGEDISSVTARVSHAAQQYDQVAYADRNMRM